jgi:metal-sulfur cluster biosynthetic enzyme
MSETESPAVELPDQAGFLEILKAVKDPDVGVNIVDLGLIYTVATRGSEVDVEMTLTSPACPAAPQIIRDATETLQAVPGVSKANVKLVMDPPWSPDRLSDDARDELGIF